VALGAYRVFLLPAGYACALTGPPARPIGVVLQALGLLIQRRLINDVAFYADRVEPIVLPPPCPVAVSPTDFSQARDLIERVRSTAGSWLDGGNPPRDIRNVCCRCTTTAPTPGHHRTRAAFTNPPNGRPASL
jgi:NTE family protein